MAPAETLSCVPGGPYTIHWWKVLPCKFRESSRLVWPRCHALASIAGLATSHCVDDVLAVDRKTTIFSGWLVWRVLAACCGWVVPDEKSPLPSQVHRILGATTDLPQIPCGPPTLSIAQDRVAQLTSMIRDVLESGSLNPAMACNCGVAWGSVALRCLVCLAERKTSSVLTSPT